MVSSYLLKVSTHYRICTNFQQNSSSIVIGSISHTFLLEPITISDLNLSRINEIQLVNSATNVKDASNFRLSRCFLNLTVIYFYSLENLEYQSIFPF